MGHRETYEHYYRGMSPGSSHEDAYMMQDSYIAEAQTNLNRQLGRPADNPIESHLLPFVGVTDAEYDRLYPPGSKAEHDLVGCAQLYNERCPHCHPLTLDELPAIVVGTAFDVLLAQLDTAFGRASIWFSDAQQKIARVRYPIDDDEIPF